ncbi:hypothetical protein SWVG_00013 [Synechococcus phage S-RIP1]|uniref:Uncharacterized protein n=1 Tax=Synechococcus phage S-RIP1 TaxID=754041 RepID=M4NUX6_9CAUD|nr:hypothetical protein SWVG_00013 [Synechococcus phage S-RIP1]AGG91254.1 hypothetical protein SWVG_00013 [Synechococcus phage S-RIP1]
MDLGEPPVFPSIRLPEPPNLPRPVLEVPRADIPSYVPLVVPPSDLRPPPGIESEQKDEPPKQILPPTPPIPIPQIPQPGVTTVDIPGTDIEVPVPSGEILVTAATTAFVSVAATLTATSLFKHCVSLFKPVFKQAWNKITKKTDS